VLLGAAAAEVTLLGVLGLASLRGLRAEMRARVNRVGGGLLLMVGLVWFGLRLRSG
jgi:hypothetical protein